MGPEKSDVYGDGLLSVEPEKWIITLTIVEWIINVIFCTYEKKDLWPQKNCRFAAL